MDILHFLLFAVRSGRGWQDILSLRARISACLAADVKGPPFAGPLFGPRTCPIADTETNVFYIGRSGGLFVGSPKDFHGIVIWIVNAVRHDLFRCRGQIGYAQFTLARFTGEIPMDEEGS